MTVPRAANAQGNNSTLDSLLWNLQVSVFSGKALGASNAPPLQIPVFIGVNWSKITLPLCVGSLTSHPSPKTSVWVPEGLPKVFFLYNKKFTQSLESPYYIKYII